MPRKNSARGYHVQPELTAFSGHPPITTGFGGSQHQYYYQGLNSSYYGFQLYQNHPSYLTTSWYQNGTVNYVPESSSVCARPSAEGSKFSPDAPEFIPKAMKSAVGNEVYSSQPSAGKVKKKKKKKKKKEVVLIEKAGADIPPQAEPIQQEASNTQLSVIVPENVGEPHKAMQSNILKPEVKEKNSQDSLATKESKAKPQKSVKFQEPIKEVSRHGQAKKASKNPNTDSTDVANRQAGWPEPQERSKIGAEKQMSAQPKMTFAEKLKSAPAKSPFLDWRDQRTTGSTSLSSKAISQDGQNDKVAANLAQSSAEKKENELGDDGFVTVNRKTKPKEKKPQSPEETKPSQQEKEGLKKSPEEVAKKKLEREKKKQREKEKKRKAREEKLLAEKLAPKGQKVTFITPAVMEKFLQNKQSVGKAAPSVTMLADEFPALGVSKRRGNTSESESEWETTEVEVQVASSSPNSDSAVEPQKKVKISDPIKYDLMSLIAKKTNMKQKPSKSESDRRSKNRTGVVANVLDRNAPVLSRGKIRNKKPKLSEIRKALLVAKAKRKVALGNLTNRPPSQRPHKLHSKKFREYCDQMLTDQIDQLARDMLYHLRTFQDRAFKKDPIKARMKKRLVAGLREVTKQVERKRVKIIFLAPDIQRCPETGGLDQAVQRLLDAARKHDLSIVYALSRRKMGRVLMKNVPVSCCGVLNYQATEETWKELCKVVSLARKEYQEKLKQLGLAQVSDSQNLSHQLGINETAENCEPTTTQSKENIQTDGLLDILKLSLKDQ